MKLEREMMRGAGPTAVLQLLSTGEFYGYELVEALERQSEGVLAIGQSTLYPMLYNLEAKSSSPPARPTAPTAAPAATTASALRAKRSSPATASSGPRYPRP